MFVHFTGFGDLRGLAEVVEAAIAKTNMPRTNDDNQPDADHTISGIDETEVEQILGGTSTVMDGVLEITLPCPGKELSNDGHDFPAEMGAETELHFQSLGNGNALAAPEICVC